MPRLDDAQLQSLVTKASEARLNAYAPYSQFHVGASLLSADGRIFTGVNVENASYGLSMCAERVAVGAASTAGVRSLVAIAVAGGQPGGVWPCGACRQVLAEFSPNVLVLSCRSDGTHEIMPLRDLLASPFSGQSFAESEDRQSFELTAP
ncbi:MAG: cytidine deaminase [Candidatus Eremiobacteraeota bacterium]|nr:cytidine deaminase [Candidatus Eremiobacteraeota bacterium]MBC5828061.1 cytidine deaminase [Candidatus Eremiobacteraeota bacterium]